MALSRTNILIVVILAIAFFLRIYSLGVIPPGLTNDEADIGYDAYSILHTGRDQWGQFLPTTSFKGFGDYRLPLYTYLVLPVVMVFDLTAFSVRLPSAIFGTISVLLIYFLAKKIFEKTGLQSSSIGLFSALLFAISPWSMGLSRIGIESNVAITIILAALLAFFYSFKKPILLILSSILFSLTLYTYTSYAMFTPLVIVMCAVFYRKELKRFKKTLVISSVIFIISIVPLLLFKSTANVRATQIAFFNNVDSIGLLANLNDKRGSCSQVYPVFICKITQNKQLVFADTFVRNYLNHFSASTLYLNGTSNQYSILPARSLFYTIELLFLLGGILFAFLTKNKSLFFLLTLLVLAPIPDALTSDGHYSRASNMMPFVYLIESVGFVYLWNNVAKSRQIFSYTVRIVISSFLLFSFLSLLVSYYSYFPKYYSTFTQFGYEQWAQMINENKNNYKRIYLSLEGNDTKQYVYYLFYSKYDPKKFQNKDGVLWSTSSGGWVSVDKIDNLYFVDRIPSEQKLNYMKNQKVLLVTNPVGLPKEFNIQNVQQVKDKNGNTIFAFIDSKALIDYYNTYSPELLQ